MDTQNRLRCHSPPKVESHLDVGDQGSCKSGKKSRNEDPVTVFKTRPKYQVGVRRG